MRLNTAVALICATTLVLTGCARERASSRRLAFITNNAADFWTIARKGTEKADAELTDVTVEFRLGDGTAAARRRIVDDLLAQCGLRACKTVMKEGGVIMSDAVRHPLEPLHPATRASLLELAAEVESAGASLGEIARQPGFATTPVRCARC